MKKKYIAILLGITLGMTALAGCSGTSTSESSTT
jgi:ABC-type glycerol-3-phosphate transport system substrate-binding protein